MTFRAQGKPVHAPSPLSSRTETGVVGTRSAPAASAVQVEVQVQVQVIGRLGGGRER